MNLTRARHTTWPDATRTIHPSCPPYRILVAEDDAPLRALVERMLVSIGYRVDTAEDGLAAWDRLLAGGHDLLLTDHDMPGLSGVDLVKRLRDAGIGLPVVLVSGAMPAAALKLNQTLDLSATVAKPFTGEVLAAVLDGALQRPRPSGFGEALPPGVAGDVRGRE